MKEQILKLRDEGKSYRQIVDILGCSKGTVAYHCGNKQKEKTLNRTRNLRKENVIRTKCEKFCEGRYYRKIKKSELEESFKEKKDKPTKQTLHEKCSFFRKKTKTKIKYSFRWQDVVEKFGWEPNCYLTGRKIDLKNGAEYHFDHIVPLAKGGSCEIDNLGITHKNANIAKRDMLLDDFIQLCKEVLIHNGYDVKKCK